MRVVFVGAGGLNGIGSAAGGHIIFLMNELTNYVLKTEKSRDLALLLS